MLEVVLGDQKGAGHWRVQTGAVTGFDLHLEKISLA